MHEHSCFVSNMFASRPYFIDNVSADVKDWGYPTHAHTLSSNEDGSGVEHELR